MATVKPNTAIWNLGNLYIDGMRLSVTDTTHLSVTQGGARDSTNLNDIVLALPPQNDGTPILTPFTINSALNGAGGLDTGTIANSSLYAIYVIASSCNSHINLPPSPQESLAVPPFTTPDLTSPVVQDGYYVQANVIISLSFTNPLLPYGFDMFRRIGAVRTDGSAHFLPFSQTGFDKDRIVTLGSGGVNVLTAGAQTGTYASIGSLAALVPPRAEQAILSVSFTPAAAGGTVSFQPFGGTGAYATITGYSSTTPTVAQVTVPVGLNGAVPEIDYQNSAAGGSTTVALQGYIDQL